MSAAIWKALAESAPLLSIDMDGVLCHLEEMALAVINARFGTSYAYEDMTRYWLGDVLTPEQVTFAQQWFRNAKHYLDLPPDRVCAAIIRQAKKEGRTVWIASDRPDDALNVSALWLQRHGVPYDRLLVQRGIKDEIAASGRSVIFLDDNDLKVNDLPGPNAELVLIRKPWTKTYDQSGVVVADTWGDVCHALGVGYPDLNDLMDAAIG